MAGNVNVKLAGGEILLDLFHKLDEKIQKTVVKDALKQTAEAVKTSAQRLTPSSRIARFMTVKGYGTVGKFGFKVMFPTREQLDISPNDKYYWPAALEFGTEKMKAQPALRPATYNNESLFHKLVGDAIRSAVEK